MVTFDPASAPSTIPFLPSLPVGTPGWVVQLLAGAVTLWLVATVIANVSPNSKIGVICRHIASDIRGLVARTPPPPPTAAPPPPKEDPK